MAEMLPIHEYEIDRATSRLELVRHNPTRSIAVKTSRGSAFITWQNGKWFDTGQNEIADPFLAIPPDLVDPVDLVEFRAFVERMKTDPPTGKQTGGPVVTGTCQICGDVMNDSDLNDHYLKHYRDTIANAGSTPLEADKQHESKQKHDANQLGRK